MERYWYLVAFFRFSVDFLLILAADQLMGSVSNWKKSFLASLIGLVQGILFCLPGLSFLADVHWRLIGMALTALAAFEPERKKVPNGLLFILLRLAIDSVGQGGLWSMLAIGATVLLLCGRGKIGRGHYAVVTMIHKGINLEVTALVDTGNTLIDPVSGLGVLVVGSDVAEQLLGLRESQLANPVETMASMPVCGLRLISYSAVGKPSGLLLGLRLDSLRINGERVERIVAFAPQKIGQGHGYQALAGGMV